MSGCLDAVCAHYIAATVHPVLHSGNCVLLRLLLSAAGATLSGQSGNGEDDGGKGAKRKVILPCRLLLLNRYIKV